MTSSTTVTEGDYGDGYVVWEGYGPHDGYFASCDDLREWCLEHDAVPPFAVYGTIERRLSLDASELIDRELEAAGADEEAGYRVDPIGVSSLQAFLDTWCDEFSPTWYEIDRQTVVVLDEDEWTKAKEEYNRPCSGCAKPHDECGCGF